MQYSLLVMKYMRKNITESDAVYTGRYTRNHISNNIWQNAYNYKIISKQGLENLILYNVRQSVLYQHVSVDINNGQYLYVCYHFAAVNHHSIQKY